MAYARGGLHAHGCKGLRSRARPSARGPVHRDIKPANILANSSSGEVPLTGFGIASRLPRERQSPHPPETIAGALAYMASICRSIIDAHGGKLWAEANEPRGAVFQFTLPAAQEDS
jgi:hypothetical protein